MPCKAYLFTPLFPLRVLFSIVQPSSRLVLRLYAERFARRDILIGTHEMILVDSQTGSPSINKKNPLIRFAEHFGCRRSFCARQRRQTGWTVESAGHALPDDHCVAEPNFDLVHHLLQSPIDRSKRVTPWRRHVLYGPGLHQHHSIHRHYYL